MELPDEDYDDQDRKDDNVGLLEMSLYGTRDAARNWSDTVERHLKKIGFEQGRASGNVYHHKGRRLVTLVHGDDYVTVGKEEDARWLEKELEKVYEINPAKEP